MTDPNTQMHTTDHDLLIRLDQKFESFLTTYTTDIKNLNDGITKQLAKHELQLDAHDKRIDEIERIIGIVKPEETMKDYYKFKQEIKDIMLKATTVANIYRVIAGVAGGFVVWAVTQLPNILTSLGIMVK